MTKEKILIVDDEHLIRWSFQKEFSGLGYQVSAAGSAAQAREAVETEDPDLVLLDIQLPDGSGVDLLRELRQRRTPPDVLMITANDQVKTAVHCMQQGAVNYLNKLCPLDEIRLHVERALESRRLRRQVRRWEAKQKGEYDLTNIVGESAAVQEIVKLIERIAETEISTVLIEGESGTGKDLIARAIHYTGPRSAKTFMAVNCAAIPLALLESELFGYEKGAFTDAKEAKKGLLEEACGGTLFLDEIGDMPAALQAKLLHLIDQKKFRKVGGTRELEADVRIIAATNKDLKCEVREGRFREDLFYRLCVIPIRLPPLRERKKDIPALVSYFIAHYNREFRKSFETVEDEALAVLLQYDWPGNIRELKNVIERAMILNPEPAVLFDYLPVEIQSCRKTAEDALLPGVPAQASLEGAGNLIGMPLALIEKQVIQLTMDKTGGNQSRAARMLGIGRDALRYKLQKYGILLNQPAPEAAS